ncbi:hypothetical protein [Phocaeicola plebeius]|uniref:hypothetical protein n=1 Tax=Phocaeicola plebeius TaxID=310297 RepID=UPI0026F1C29E|nr:hypothetical protein [Phocaeicola plebeius]
MDNLYGERCGVCGGFHNQLEQGIEFSKEALTQMLRDIYNGMNVRDDIQRDAFEETLRLFNEATVEGLSASSYPTGDELFLEQLRTNNEVFSAFRTHRMQNDLAAQLIDKDGKLKPFEQWLDDVQNITDHYVVRWLRTEYDTAILRAHQAADWKHFEEYKDVLPNLRWMPTTSPDPDIAHKQYWEAKLTLPVNHSFWTRHRPGDRWNCKCSLEATDEPATTGAVGDFKPVPSVPGLDNNPADDGKLFSDSHPYIKEAYPGAKKAVEKAVAKKTKFDYKQFVLDNNIAQKVEITPKKSEEEVFQKILNQLNLRMKEFNIPPFSEIGAPRSKKALASWDDSDNSLNFNLSLLNNPKKVWNKLEEFRTKKGMKYNTISSVEDLVRDVVDHELGHKLLSLYHMRMDAIDTFGKAGVTIDGRNEVSEMGYYSSLEEHEYFAEAFAMYMGPERDKMGPLTRGMIERLIAKAKKK